MAVCKTNNFHSLVNIMWKEDANSVMRAPARQNKMHQGCACFEKNKAAIHASETTVRQHAITLGHLYGCNARDVYWKVRRAGWEVKHALRPMSFFFLLDILKVFPSCSYTFSKLLQPVQNCPFHLFWGYTDQTLENRWSEDWRKTATSKVFL